MNNLRELRRRRGLTMWALAARSRVNPSLLSGIERHAYLPGEVVRARIAGALALQAAEIWPDLDPEPAQAVAANADLD